MRVLVVANRGDGDPGHVGRHLVACGARLEFVERESLEADFGPLPDLCVSLGSDWSVYWDHVQPSVAQEVALLHRCRAAGIPVLGICFGAQVLAHALGGSVEPAPEPEIGWYRVESAVRELEGDGPWFQWHSDRFTPPMDAEVLASSPRAIQAFRVGRCLGVQFHPEVDAGIVERWSTTGSGELAERGLDAGELRQHTQAEGPRAALAARKLTSWFLNEVAVG